MVLVFGHPVNDLEPAATGDGKIFRRLNIDDKLSHLMVSSKNQTPIVSKSGIYRFKC